MATRSTGGIDHLTVVPENFDREADDGEDGDARASASAR